MMRARQLAFAVALAGLALAGACGEDSANPSDAADTKAAASSAATAPAKADAATLAALSPEQQAAVRALVRDTLIANPEIMLEVQAAFEAKQTAEQYSRVQEAFADMTRQHATLSVGPANAKITVVEFFDYKCTFCHQANPWVQSLIDQRDDVRIIFKELPVLSENSHGAAKAAIAAQKQGKYWEFHNALMTARGDLNPAQVMQIAASVGLDVERLQRDMADPKVEETLAGMRDQATAIGVNGTPAFVINGTLVSGYDPNRIEAAIASAGGTPPARGAAQAPAAASAR
jgi:protein-disulfide isomerase